MSNEPAKGGDSAARPFLAKYREDQARDDQGRWVDVGNSLEPTAGRFGGSRKPHRTKPPKEKPDKPDKPVKELKPPKTDTPPSPGVQIPPGTSIRNKELAGKAHPETGIKFDSQGFPDFSGVASKTITIPGGHTGRPTDFSAANSAAGFASTPEGMSWHHHQDGRTMQLFPRDIHSRTGHTGSRGIGNLPGRK